VLTKIVHEDARKFIKALCEATEGKPMQWRTIIGLSAKQAAVDYAIEKGWILVEAGHNVCLTEEGRRRVATAAD
jgi:hypothetical protein